MRNWAAWVGMKYGTLTVEKFLGSMGTKNTYFLVRCNCGKTKKVITGDFLRGKAKAEARMPKNFLEVYYVKSVKEVQKYE